MRLREYLDATGKRPAELAAELVVADNTVHRWLAGTRTPSPAMMLTIHRVTRGLVQPNDWILN